MNHRKNQIPVTEQRYAKIDQIAGAYSIGITAARKIAIDAGALLKLGRSTLVNTETFFNYFSNMIENGGFDSFRVNADIDSKGGVSDM